jgi:hypothetical protein
MNPASRPCSCLTGFSTLRFHRCIRGLSPENAMSDLQLDDLIPPDLQAFIDDLAEEGRTAFERECEACGAAFVPRQPWGRFCSSRCRLRHWRKAQREEKSSHSSGWRIVS